MLERGRDKKESEREGDIESEVIICQLCFGQKALRTEAACCQDGMFGEPPLSYMSKNGWWGEGVQYFVQCRGFQSHVFGSKACGCQMAHVSACASLAMRRSHQFLDIYMLRLQLEFGCQMCVGALRQKVFPPATRRMRGM